jgi:hypothetical protein
MLSEVEASLILSAPKMRENGQRFFDSVPLRFTPLRMTREPVED